MATARAPGLIVAMIIAGIATLAARRLHWPDMIIALGLGLVLAQTLRGARWRSGFDFAARPVLRAGIALLAFRVTLSQLATLGWPAVATVVVCIAAVFAAAWALGRLLRIPPWFTAIAATSVAICGASAALAAAAALPKRPRLQEATLFVCVAVSLIGTIAMILYPTLAHLANWSSAATAVFLGAAIHEVAQVVGAAFALSPEHGELATLTKLLRVAMLAPVIMLLRWRFARAEALADDHRATHRVATLPWFLVAFVVLVVAGSFVTWPPLLVDAAAVLSRTCLLTAIAALGLLTHTGSLLRLGWRPVLLMVALSVVIALVAGIGVTTASMT
jgi:uncharacterized integral membrane protein (TIGR00698 family)